MALSQVSLGGLKGCCNWPFCQPIIFITINVMIAMKLFDLFPIRSCSCSFDSCGVQFSSKQKLERHKRRHVDGYDCPRVDCEVNVPTWSALQEHLKSHPKCNIVLLKKRILKVLFISFSI